MDIDLLKRELTLEMEGVPVITPCVEVVVIGRGAFAASRAGYQLAYERFARRWGDRIRLCAGYDDAGMRDYRPSEWADVSAWLEHGLDGSISYGAHFQAGMPAQSAVAPMFDAVHIATQDVRSGMRIALPLDVLDNGPEPFQAMFAEALEGASLSYAFCGVALAWNAEYLDIESRFQKWAVPKLLRHPGLLHGDYMPYVLHADHGLLTIGWLTAVGADGARQIGGKEALARILPADCGVSVRADGTLILRAGEVPAIGDVNRGNALPTWRAVAQALAPAWCPDEKIDQINLRPLEPEVAGRWLRRFHA